MIIGVFLFLQVQRKPSFLRYNRYQPQEAVFSEPASGIFRRLEEAPPGGGTGAEATETAAGLPPPIALLPWQHQYTSDSVNGRTRSGTENRSNHADDRGGKSLSATPMGSTTKLVGDKTPDEKVSFPRSIPHGVSS